MFPISHPHPKTAVALIFVVIGLLETGCATLKPQSFPDQSGPLTIGVIDKPFINKKYEFSFSPNIDIKKLDMTVEVGKGDDSVSSGLFLSPLARFVVLGTDISEGAKKGLRSAKDNLALDLMAETKNSLQKELSKPGSRFSYNEDPEQDSVLILPLAFLSFVGNEKARLWMVLMVELNNPYFDQNEGYEYYIVALGQPRPIGGGNSWTSNQEKTFKKTVASDLSLAIQTMMDDFDGKIRDQKAPTKVINGRWMFSKKPIESTVQVLKNTKNWEMISNLKSEDYPSIAILPNDFFEPVPEPTEKK